jgi:glycerate kinase
MSLDRVYTLAEYTDRDSSKDAELSAALLHRIGRDIGETLLLRAGGSRKIHSVSPRA